MKNLNKHPKVIELSATVLFSSLKAQVYTRLYLSYTSYQDCHKPLTKLIQTLRFLQTEKNSGSSQEKNILDGKFYYLNLGSLKVMPLIGGSKT